MVATPPGPVGVTPQVDRVDQGRTTTIRLAHQVPVNLLAHRVAVQGLSVAVVAAVATTLGTLPTAGQEAPCSETVVKEQTMITRSLR